jgi:hypothetical protein
MGQVNELKNFSRGQIDAALMKIGQDADLYNKLVDRISKNEHGHYVFTITGLDLTGKKEIARMEKGNFRLSDYARQTLTSINADSYNANHRLEDGKEYNIVLVPGREVKKNRMTANIQKYARSFGYEVPFAGVIPRIREAVSDKQMEQMNIWYIACLHMPIKDTDGDPSVLGVRRHGVGRCLYAFWDDPDSQWRGHGAFAFLVLAS